MDAAEADADIKLYKASAELLLELRAKVPKLVQTQNKEYPFRKWVIQTKVYEVTNLLDRFQEWPQLLDHHLASLIQVLVDAYLSYSVLHPHEYIRPHNLRAELSPLPRAVASVLYAFCKVRGQKIIVRLLNNEPKYIEPLLSAFRLWTSQKGSAGYNAAPAMTWEERYIHLIWLSHLMLAPFELSNISMLSVDASREQSFPELYAGLPNISVNLAMAGLDDLYVSSKAREAACVLLVRLCLRSDMQKLGLAQRLVDWAIHQLQTPSSQLPTTGYQYIGLLALIFGIVNSASTSEVSPFLHNAFQLAYTVANSTDPHFQSIRDSAPARKLLINIMRSTVIHAIVSTNALSAFRAAYDPSSMLEDCIQSLLDLLADKDTPVRQAASKALSLICLKLDEEMSTAIVEAVIDNLNENLLLEDVTSGRLFPATDMPKDASANYRKNMNAIDPLRWHGCMLTLGHLLFRRSLSISLLPSVIEVILMGLNFEQRSNVGTSVGVGVRDAACFGVWSLARKYSTSELNHAKISWDLLPVGDLYPGVLKGSTLQVIATQLILSSCLDPSGNLRRGSSAALQELIGRHPDIIAEGIPIVQAVDYHAVARRSRAVTEVAIQAAKLSPYYHSALLYALLAWRGARATDADSRRQAAQAIGTLTTLTSMQDIQQFLEALVAQIRQLRTSNTGSNAQSRHGLLCCLAAVLENLTFNIYSSNATDVSGIVIPVLEGLTSAAGTINGRVTADIEYVLEGISKVILASSTLVTTITALSNTSNPQTQFLRWAESILPILERCTVSSDKAFVTDVAAQAATVVLRLLSSDLQQRLISSWLDKGQQSKSDYASKGRISTLSVAYNYLHAAPGLALFEQQIVIYMGDIVHKAFPIETKVNAMQGIITILVTSTAVEKPSLDTVVAAVHTGLSDYTTDQRGDIGSLLRLESIEAASRLLYHITGEQKQRTLQLLVRLATERLIKVRFQAWKCLEPLLYSRESSAQLDHWLDAQVVQNDCLPRSFEHQADVASFEYSRVLVELLQLPQYHDPLLTGLISSISSGTEDVTRACVDALVAYIQDQNEDIQESLVASILGSTTRYVSKFGSGDDREIIPAIEFLTLLNEQVVALQPDISIDSQIQSVWELCQKMHTPSSTIARLEAMVRLYSAMTMLNSIRIRALDKLTRLLLHRWPKIRGAAADAIAIHTTTDSLILCDWNAMVAENKPKVLTIRKELNVAGVNA